MIDAGQVIAYLDLDSSKYSKGMRSAIDAVKDLGNAALPTSAKIKGIGSAMSQVGRDASSLTLAIAAVGTASVTAYAQLDTASRKVSTVADASILSLQGIKDGTRELSNELRTMPTDISQGLYDMISANNDTANAMDYTRIAVKAAKGGFTDTATAVDGLTTVLNAYAMTGVDNMQRVSDQMLIAQNVGKTTFGAIAASIGNVIPLAAQLKTGTDELFASLAVLTSQGIGTSEAITGLKAVYAGILKPTADATKAAQAMGLDFSATALRAKGLGGFLDEIVAKTGGSADKITTLFGSVEALNTVLALTSDAGRKSFTSTMEAMQNSAGATDKAYQTMVGGIEGSFDHVKVAAVNLGSELAEDFAPKLEDLADWLAETTEWFSKLPPEMRSTIVTVAGLAAALGPVLIIGGKLVTAFGALTSVMSGPAGWIALGIAGVTALAVGLNNLNTSADEAQDAFVAKYGQSKEQIEADTTVKKDVNLDVDVTTNAGANVTSAVDKLRGILNSIDVLTDDERDAVLAMIGKDLDPIKSALSAAGLTDGQADAVQTAIDTAVQTLRDKLSGMKFLDTDTQSKIVGMIGEDHDTLQADLTKLELTPDEIEDVTVAVLLVQGKLRTALAEMDVLSPAEISKIMTMISDDKATLIKTLKGMGLTDAEAQEVATAINGATGTLTSGVYSLYDTIYQQLTDGQPDTEQQTTDLQTQVQDYYNGLISGIQLDTETQLTNLKTQLDNGFISMDEYDTKAKEITDKNGALITSVQQTCTDTLTYVSSMSGQSTTVVQDSLTKIEELKQKALEEAAAIEQLKEEAQSAEGKNAQFQVKSGAKVDQDTIDLAFQTAYNQKQVATYGAEQNSKTRQDEINKSYQSAYETKQKAGAPEADLKALTVQRDKLIADEQAKLAAQKQEIQNTYTQTMAELTKGLSESNPQIAAGIQEAVNNLNIYEELSKDITSLAEGGSKPSDVQFSDAAKKLIQGMFKIDVDNTEWKEGILDDLDPGKENMAKLLRDVREKLYTEITDYISADDGGTKSDLGQFGTTFAMLLKESMIDGINNSGTLPNDAKIDLAKAFLTFASGGTGSVDVQVPTTITPVEPEGTDNQQGIVDYIVEDIDYATVQAAQQGHQINVPVTLNPVSSDGTSAIDALRDAISRGDGDVAAAAAGLASAAQGELDGMQGDAKTAGTNAIQGLTNGAEAKRTPLINEFKSLATAAYQAVKDVLHINSPSKVFREIGLNTAKGFQMGVEGGVAGARESMRRLVAVGAFAPSNVPVSGQAGGGVVNNHYAAPVNITFPGAVVRSDSDIRELERRTQRIARDLQYGLGARP